MEVARHMVRVQKVVGRRAIFSELMALSPSSRIGGLFDVGITESGLRDGGCDSFGVPLLVPALRGRFGKSSADLRERVRLGIPHSHSESTLPKRAFVVNRAEPGNLRFE